MAQAVLYPEQPKQVDVVVENPVVVSTVALSKVGDDSHKKNRIQVSNTKKPLFFYLNLAKRYMKQHNDIELSALGMAIPTLVTIAEILKANGVAVEKKVLTSTVDSKDENKGRVVQKAKLEIFLEKKIPAATSSAEAKPKENAAAGKAESETKSTVDETKPENKAATDVVKKEG
ncbi:uncharacterized protein At2g34160-like [Silene latifolia]|uniref:uncharacterized protein At2g34160-like n=1 Tax=Silene latifolia TaxID=37657 RepID=UPI003D78A1F3